MATMTYEQQLDLINFDFTDLSGGSATPVSNTEIDLSDAPYTGQLHGTGFLTGSGTITGLDAQLNGDAFFSITGLSLSESQALVDKDNQAAITNDVFGGNDAITGSKHNDGLAGYGGDDVLKGGKGADTLLGGSGADHLVGGAGADVYLYTAVSDSVKGASDVISGWDTTDTIDLTALDVMGRITSAYNANKDLTMFKIDVDGDHKADLFIGVHGQHTTDDVHFVT